MDLSTLRGHSVAEIGRLLQTTPSGLSSAEAKHRLSLYGPNQIEREGVSWWRLLLKQVASPFVYLLLASAVLSLVLGNRIEGIMILAFIILNGVLGFFQEYHAEKAVAMLEAILRPSCTVYRNGKSERISCRELVPGDLCLVELGDIVPADGIFIEAQACSCDEAVLTGESFPVAKQSSDLVFAGTKITQGWGKFFIAHTGRETSLGKIAKLTSETTVESAYQRSLRHLSNAILCFVVIAVLLTFALRLLFPGQSELNWIQFAIFSVALAVSVVPETLPLVVTICLSRGAVLMAKKQVVVKRLNAIEDLGSIQILCTDKTGTLTQNVLRVADVKTFTDDDPRVIALRSVERERLKRPDELDPFTKALLNGLSKESQALIQKHRVESHLPFDPKRKRVTVFVRVGQTTQIISCGAPEEVLKRCVKTPSSLRPWLIHQGKMGRRVLVVAGKIRTSKKRIQDLDAEEQDLILVGALAFEDPLKPTAATALAQIRALGVEVKMLTGDSPDVATAIALQVGLIQKKEEVLTGDAWAKLRPPLRKKVLASCKVFARVNPEQKYEIIKELERHGTVGFLGEGINDAPALKLAHVGIAVREASDIAREAADIILLDKGLDVIAEGMTQGRRVFVNIGKYIRATLVSNFGNFFAVVISLFFIPTLPMLPMQILLLNLLSDFPMTAICLDTVEDREVAKPIAFPIRSLLFFCVTLGTLSTVFDFLFFTIYRHLALSHLQVMWFLASVLTELALVFSLRSSRWFFQGTPPAKALWITTLLAAIAAFCFTCLEPLRTWFSFPLPTLPLLGITAVLVIAYFFLTDIVKRLYGRFIGIPV